MSNVPEYTTDKLKPSKESKNHTAKNPFKTKEKKQDQDMVQKLSLWEKKNSESIAVDAINQAKNLLSRRLKHENSVEEAINSRKKNFLARCRSTSPTLLRSKKEEKLSFKETSNFHKMYEEDLQRHLNDLTKQFEQVFDKRQKMRSELAELREELKESQNDLETCKFKLEKLERHKNLLKKKEPAHYFARKNTFRDEIFKKESRCAEISQELSREINKNKFNLENLDKETAKLRKEISIFKEAIVEHYKKLLDEGLDSRSDGLQWIVLKLWDLGQKVERNDFAAFLDEGLVENILMLAEKNKELDELIGKISIRVADNKKFFTSSQEKLNEVHLRLAQASKNIRIKKPEVVVFKDRKSAVMWENCNPGFMDYKLNASRNLIEVQQRITTLRSEIMTIKDNEVVRLFKLCFLTGYEAKRKVDLNTLMSALVGYENLDKYSALVIKLKRDMLEKLASNKSLRFSNEKDKF